MLLQFLKYIVVGSAVASLHLSDAFSIRRLDSITASVLSRERHPRFPVQAIALPMDFDESSSSTVDVAPKVGVLLLNLGGPETGDDVEGTCHDNLSRVQITFDTPISFCSMIVAI
jgi:hypothetical protein